MGSLKLGRIAGIEVSLHWTLLLLVAFVALNAPAGGVLWQVTLVTALFGCVLLHELGHALAARQFGIGTHGITLLLFGGIATLERMPRRPQQELWIAVAGPLVNVVISGALLILMGPISDFTAAGLISTSVSVWVQHLMIANIGLVMFNMLPAFPMDGGRVFRAVMAFRLPYLKATQLAATVGKALAFGLALIGLVSGQFMLIIVAAFVVIAGSAETRLVASEHRQMRWPDHEFPGNARAQGEWRARSETVVWDAAAQKYRVAGINLR